MVILRSQSRSSGVRSLPETSSCSNNKRGKTETPSSSSSLSSSELSNFCLNDLPVNLIQEVLQRLHNAKSAFLFKCVCKKWYSLISTPYFAHRFITHHFNHQYKQNPSAVFICFLKEPYGFELFTVSDEPMFKSRGFELSFLPERKLVEPLATFNDLMLCSVSGTRRNLGIVRYYICNPFTMDWIALPLLELDKGGVHTREGFVCEPYYFEDSQGECTINPKFRFRIVRFVKVGTQQFVVKTYQSETQQWHRSVLEGSENDYHFLFCTKGAAYNGKLLWYNGKQIFAHDPFNPQLSTFVDCPFSFGIHNFLGVCQGFLRFMQFRNSDQTSGMALSIWELKDNSMWKWSLEDKVDVNAMIPENSLVNKIVHDSKYTLTTLSFHPSDRNIVYFHDKAFVISYNCQSTELKLVGKVPYGYVGLATVFGIELQLWPTPIPRMD